MNNKKFGRSIKLFLVEGDPALITTAELSNWNATCIKTPRDEIIPNKDRFQQCGVYFLFTAENSVYIGEAENVYERLESHLYNYEHGKVDYYFTHCVVFESEKLNKSMCRYLENRATELSKENERMEVLTKSTYKRTVLKESDIAECDEFFDNMKIIMSVFGYNIFEKKIPFVKTIKDIDEESEEIIKTNIENDIRDEYMFNYYQPGGTVKLDGIYKSANGYTIKIGTQLNRGSSASDKANGQINKKIDALLKENKINEDLVVIEEFEVHFSAWAAMLMTGKRYISVSRYFVDKNNVSIKDRGFEYLKIDKLFKAKLKGEVISSGYLLDTGEFLLQKGNKIYLKESSTKNEQLAYKELLETKKINEDGILQEDCLFNSSSAALAFCLKKNYWDGWQHYKTEDGILMDDYLHN